MSWSKSYRVRYVECDQKFERFGWELMVKASNIVWHSPAASGDTLKLEMSISRWGNTSFDTDNHRPLALPADVVSHLGG